MAKHAQTDPRVETHKILLQTSPELYSPLRSDTPRDELRERMGRLR